MTLSAGRYGVSEGWRKWDGDAPLSQPPTAMCLGLSASIGAAAAPVDLQHPL